MFLMNESENVQCSYNIQYTIFGMMSILFGRCCNRGEFEWTLVILAGYHISAISINLCYIKEQPVNKSNPMYVTPKLSL